MVLGDFTLPSLGVFQLDLSVSMDKPQGILRLMSLLQPDDGSVIVMNGKLGLTLA